MVSPSNIGEKMELQMVIKAASVAELQANLNAALKALDAQGVTTTTPPKTTKKGKAAAAPEVVEEAPEEIESFDGETTSDEGGEELGFDAPAEEPAAPAKSAKAPKITEKDVNEACKAHARKHGRPATLKILKSKFNAESIVEIKAENYAKVIAALKV